MENDLGIDELAVRLAFQKLPNYELLHWRPIAEAKKDGTPYLLWHENIGCLFGFCSSSCDEWISEAEEIYEIPTHFAEVRGPKK